MDDLSQGMVVDESLFHWFHLNSITGLGPVHIAKILERFGSPAAFLNLDQAALRELGCHARQVRQIKNPPKKLWAEVGSWLQVKDHHLITCADDAYPAMLKQIPSAPALLYVKGNISVLRCPFVAMVGSRNPSRHGLQQAYDFAYQLATLNLGICSGMALGIDARAHWGAIEAGGVTVAVMGAGLHHIYPARHKRLAEEICLQGGALVSEFLLHQRPAAAHFPQRNRIIAGMSRATLVVEAACKSGSLITARYANDQGRCVMAIPGSIYNPLKAGPHSLIRDGALLVSSIEDVLSELLPGQCAVHQGAQAGVRKGVNASNLRQPLLSNSTVTSQSRSSFQPIEYTDNYMNLDKHCLNILAVLSDTAFSIDAIVHLSNMNVKKVMICLHKLQHAGMVMESMGIYQRK